MEENKKIYIEKNLIATGRNRPRHKKYYEGFYSAESIDELFTNSTCISKHSELDLDDGTNPHGTTKTDVGLGNVPNTDFTSAVAANTAKVGITPTQANEIAANTLKVSLDKAYTDTVNIPAASGTVNIDFSLGIHFNITLVGNTTLTFSNYLPYKSIKVQTLQIKSASAAHTLALPAGVTFTTAIDLSTPTKNNFLSVNILGTDLFQCANLVKTIV